MKQVNDVTAKHDRAIFITYMLLTIAFLGMIGINIYAYITVVNLSKMYSNLNNSAITYKLKLLTGNLMFREIVSGFSAKDMNEVWTLLNDAKAIADDIEKTGVASEAKLSEKTIAFKETVLNCYKYREQEQKVKDFSRKYNAAFNELLERVDGIESKLKDLISEKLHVIRMLYIILIVNILLVFMFMIFIFNSYIGRRKAAEEELISMQENLQTIINSLDTMIVTVDPHGTVWEWNNKAEEYFSKIVPTVQGHVLWNVVPFFKDFQKVTEQVYHSKRAQKFMRSKIFYDNAERFFNLYFLPLPASVGGVLIRVEDVTTYEMKEEQMRLSQKMEVVENLVGGLANDFNNVLGAITGTISMMRYSGEKSISSEDFKNNIDLIESSAERAIVMVQQWISMFQKRKPEAVKVDLNKILAHVIKICQNTFDKRINFETDPYDVMAAAKAEPTHLIQLLLNLCDNAAQAMTTMRKDDSTYGGLLSISIDRLIADKNFKDKHPGAKAGSYWILKVSDTGVGIPRDLLPKIFDPFFTTKNGTGLGLSMAVETVKSMNGFIEVDSEVGKGTVFTIYIPELVEETDENQAAPVVKPVSAADQVPVGTGLVLVVDDEAIMRKTAGNILSKLGYQVIFAEDGEQAVEIFKQHNKDIRATLLDMAMPKMSGKEAYVEMKKIDPSLKVLLVSGFKNDERIQSVLELGINGFVQKPYTMSVLAQEVKKLLTAA